MNQADYFKCRHPGPLLLGVKVKAIEERTKIFTLSHLMVHSDTTVFYYCYLYFQGKKTVNRVSAYWLSSKCYVLPAH